MILWLLAMAPVDPLAGATWTARMTSYPVDCARDATLEVQARRDALVVAFTVSGPGITGLGGDVPVVVARIARRRRLAATGGRQAEAFGQALDFDHRAAFR